jgi:hypothetical protein
MIEVLGATIRTAGLNWITPKSPKHFGDSHTTMNQKRLPPRLIGCLTPRLVDGPATTLSLSPESLELETAFFAFFAAGGLGGGEELDATYSLAGFWASLDIERSVPLLSTGTGERAIGGLVGRVDFFSISCPSSEFSVAESSSDFVFGGPVWIMSTG